MEENKSWQDETVEIPAEVNGEKTTANVRLEDLEHTFQEVRFECSASQRMELLKDPDLSEYLKLHDIQVLSVIRNTLDGCFDYLNLHRFSSDSESFGDTTLGNIFDKFNALLAEFQKMDSESLADFFLEMRDIVRRGKKKLKPQIRYIMVQKPEMTPEGSEARKAGYENICEIGKERIRRAGAKIQKENPEGSRGLDVGFRVYKVIPPEEAADDLSLVTIFTLAFDLTLDLSIDKCTDGGLEWYDVGDGKLFAVLQSSLKKEDVERLAKYKPEGIGFYAPMEGADEMETSRLVHEFSPETKVKFF